MQTLHLQGQLAKEWAGAPSPTDLKMASLWIWLVCFSFMVPILSGPQVTQHPRWGGEWGRLPSWRWASPYSQVLEKQLQGVPGVGGEEEEAAA